MKAAIVATVPKPPPSPAVPARSGANAQLLQAAAAALGPNPEEARQIAERVLKADRGNVPAAVILGRALMLMNRADEAVAPLERAARRGHDPSAEVLLASALAAAGRSEDALRQIRQAVERHPAFSPTYIELAKLLSFAGKAEEAIAVLETGLARIPDAIELLMVLAGVLCERNDRARARELLSQASARAPGRQDILAELARVTQIDGEYAAAAEIYRRALALQSDAADTRANYGACLLELGKREAGEAAIREAARGRPQMFGRAIASMAVASHGRFFLRPSKAAKFLR